MSVGKQKYFVFLDNNHDGVSSPPRFHARDVRPPRPPPPPDLTVPVIPYAAERVIGRAHAHPRPASFIDYPAAASQQQRRAGGDGHREHTAASISAATEYLCAPPVCCLLGPYRWSVHVTRARIFFLIPKTAERTTVANEEKKITIIVIKNTSTTAATATTTTTLLLLLLLLLLLRRRRRQHDNGGGDGSGYETTASLVPHARKVRNYYATSTGATSGGSDLHTILTILYVLSWLALLHDSKKKLVRWRRLPDETTEVEAIGRTGVLRTWPTSSSGGVRAVVRSRAMPSVVAATAAAAAAAASSTGHRAVVVHSPLLCARCVVRCDLSPSGGLR
ncbi:hypothetical protein QTP88_002094 [Uroleucon formosanum]